MRFKYTSDDPNDPRYCISIEDEFPAEDGEPPWGLITIAEENLSSSAATARTTSIRNAIDLTTEQAQWLYFALGRILLERGGRDPNCIHGVTDEQANQKRPGLPSSDRRDLHTIIKDSMIGSAPADLRPRRERARSKP